MYLSCINLSNYKKFVVYPFYYIDTLNILQLLTCTIYILVIFNYALGAGPYNLLSMVIAYTNRPLWMKMKKTWRYKLCMAMDTVMLVADTVVEEVDLP